MRQCLCHVQANFQATEPLSSLQTFVKACLTPNGPSWYLFTTPPKQVLKDARPTLFQAGLVPAAIVYIGISESPASSSMSHIDSAQEPQNGFPSKSDHLLRPELMAVLGEQPQWIPRKRTDTAFAQGNSGSAAEKGKGSHAGDGAAGFSNGRARDEKAKKGPKWLKLGAK